MIGIIKWIGPLTNSRSGGVYKLVAIDLPDTKEGRAHVYLNPEHRNYEKWSPLLEKGNTINGLVWRDKNSKTLDGDSPVELI
tara:strand:+ start:240 stop:485 length:246 start_codon:yes stop_codon:yes gene_type:complete